MKGSGLVLFACAGLMMSGGTILGGSAAFCLFRMSHYFWTTDLGVELGCGLLFVAGSLLCLPICWLCTIVPYHLKSGHLLGTLMLLTTCALTLISLGMSTLTDVSRAVREPAAVNASMLRAMSHAHLDSNVRASFAVMQQELNCCGVNSFTDWHQYRRTLPQACCGRGRDWHGKKSQQCSFPVNNVGCLRAALAQLRSYSTSMAVLASVVILVLSVILFTAAYTLANGIVEASEAGSKSSSSPISAPPAPAPFRAGVGVGVACLPHSLLHGRAPPSALVTAPPVPALTHI